LQRPLAPIGKHSLKTPHNPRDRALRKRCTTQKRRQGSPNPPPVRSTEITSQKSTVHRSSAPLITLDQNTLPLLLLSSFSQPCPRQLDHRCSQPRADRSLSTAVAIAAPIAMTLVGQRHQNLSQLRFCQCQNHLSHFSTQRFAQPIRSEKIFHSAKTLCTFLHRRVPPRPDSLHEPVCFLGYRENTPFLFSTTIGREHGSLPVPVHNLKRPPRGSAMVRYAFLSWRVSDNGMLCQRKPKTLLYQDPKQRSTFSLGMRNFQLRTIFCATATSQNLLRNCEVRHQMSVGNVG